MHRGFAYLVVVLDWYSRRVLAWRLSNTLTTDFCLEVVEEAIRRYGVPEIFNTDQGSQFTSDEFTDLLKENGIRIIGASLPLIHEFLILLSCQAFLFNKAPNMIPEKGIRPGPLPAIGLDNLGDDIEINFKSCSSHHARQ